MTSTIDNIYIDNDCKHGDSVQYRVRSVAKDGRCSDWSLPASIQVGDLTPPPDPINFNVTSGYAGCLLTWQFPDDPTYKFTEVFRQTRASGQSAYYDGVIVSSIESTDFRLVGTYRAEEAFICGDLYADYCFKIRHVDNSGNKSNFSSVICATTRGIKSVDIDKTPGEPRIYEVPPSGYIPANDVYIASPNAYPNWFQQGGNLKEFVEFTASENNGLNNSINTLSNIINQQQATINNLTDQLRLQNAKINNIDGSLTNLGNKISRAVSDMYIYTPEGTLQGNYSVIPNINGLKTIEINLDVNSNGLVNAIKNNFVLKSGVTTGVSGQIVGSR